MLGGYTTWVRQTLERQQPMTATYPGALKSSGSWVHYASVRAADHVCVAVFDPRSLSMVSPEGRYEQWHCHAKHDRVTLSNGRVRFDF